MGRKMRIGLATGGAVVALAAASTLGLGAALGAFGPVAATPSAWPSAPGNVPAACDAPSLPGTVVTVTLVDMGRGGMMGGGFGSGTPGGMMRGRPGQGAGSGNGWTFPRGMMAVRLTPGQVGAGSVSLRVLNEGSITHELVVLPLSDGAQPGQRPLGSDGKVSESGSLGEASRTCAAGSGEGIAPHRTGWVTLDLKPGRYELVCNLPGHYAAGMFAELDVTT